MNVPALARAPRGVSRASTSSPSFTNQIRRRHPRARPTSRGFDDIDAIAETADEDDYTKWQRTEPDAQAWKNYADAQGEGGSFTVGAKPLDEKFLSELMLALLRNHRRGLRAEVLLHKVRSNMELDGYKSLLVGVGRMEMWELAREIIDFVKAEGRERGDEVVTSNWFMALAGRRLEEKAYDATCDVFGYMREFGSVPSGETIEVFAKLTDAEPFMSREQRERIKEIGRWLADSDAGQALWHIHFGNPAEEHQPGAPGTLKPDRTINVALDSDSVDIYGDIDKLREQLKDFY